MDHAFPRMGLLLAFTLIIGCSKKEVKAGDPCETHGEIQCVDKKNGAFCVNGKYEVMACEGPTGCMSVAGKGSCTHHNYVEGEPCFEEGKPECRGDKTAMLECKHSHWVKTNDCKGALGCVSNAQGARCDLGASAQGESCTPENEGNAACTEDKKALLMCKGGRMEVASTCKGMHGCRQLGEELQCDSSIADVGDPCEDGTYACSVDKKSRLACKSGKMASDQACNCSVMLDEIKCD